MSNPARATRTDAPRRRPAIVEIAKALSQDASILIMDEPTSALTESEVERLFRIIDRLLARGVTIVYISHKLDEVFRRSDRITVLRDGRHVKTLDRAATNPREITHLMVGREIENVNLAENRSPGDVVLEVAGLSLPWTGHARAWRLRDINFTLRRGEVLGVAGLMGRAAPSFSSASSARRRSLPRDGSCSKAGSPFASPADAKRAGVALVTEDRKRLGLFPHMNVRENITICMLEETASAGLIAGRQERRAARESIELLAIKTPGSEASITGLSGGNQQKAIIARWLRTRPKCCSWTIRPAASTSAPRPNSIA